MKVVSEAYGNMGAGGGLGGGMRMDHTHMRGGVGRGGGAHRVVGIMCDLEVVGA